MARDYKKIEDYLNGEIIYDEGEYTFVPKDFTPYKYKKSKSLNTLRRMLNDKRL